MTIADKIEDHQARCAPHVLRLRMIAHDEVGGPQLAGRNRGHPGHRGDPGRGRSRGQRRAGRSRGWPGAATFLGVRLSRLTAAANDAIAAAGEGDSGLLRRHLHRFEVLTSAIWTVQQKPCPVRIPVATRSSHSDLRKTCERLTKDSRKTGTGVARGQLRIYLGAAPGVGKTYAMLAEAQRRRARGTDVVVGLLKRTAGS